MLKSKIVECREIVESIWRIDSMFLSKSQHHRPELDFETNL